MGKRFSLFSFLLCLQLFCIAEDRSIDSLKKYISARSEDTLKVKALIDLSSKYKNISPDSAILYANEAKAISETLNYAWGLGYSLKAIGLVYNLQSKYGEALTAWKEALKVFEENNMKVGASNMQNNIGVVYYSQVMEDSAQTYYLKSLKTAEELKDPLRIATALVNVGAVYSNKEETYDKALDYYLKSLVYSEASGDIEAIGTSTVNIGEVFLNKAIHIDKGPLNKNRDADKNRYLDSSQVYLMRARKAYIGNSNLPYALNTLGKMYRQKKNYELSITYHQQAFDTAKTLDSKLDMAQALLGIAETDTAKKDYNGAIVKYYEAEKLLKETTLNETYDIKHVYEGLSDSYLVLNDYRSAANHLKTLVDVNKKIYDNETNKKLQSQLFMHDIDKAEGEINLQKAAVSRQKLIRNGFVGGFAIVLMFAGVFLAQRNRINKEKKRSDELLLNILPEETAEELKLTGTAKAKSFDSVSVLFTDFKNFTQASEKLSPEELVQEINHCYSEFDKIITKHGLEKIKTIGDAYMCAGGLPVPNTTHPTDIIKAGLEMVRFIEKNKKDRLEKDLPFFELRCGIHTGPVVAGIVGIKKFAYDIWGDTVNTASRMESSGEIGKVNISGETFELVKNQFQCTYRGKVKAKNKGEIDMYFVESVV
jgi:adenylate cyclase